MSLLRTTRLAAFAAILAGAATQAGCYIDAGPDAEVPGQPGGEDSPADFEEPLSASGAWVDLPTYGHVWVPAEEVVGQGYVPYATGGQWVATDAGWVFQSQWDNDFGWAVYHYGRWVYTDDYGWAWIPDVEWGPAWVDWRYGGAYVGWAPLGPVGVALVPGAYVFVETRYIGDPGFIRYRVPGAQVGVAYGATVASGEYRMNGGARWALGPPASHFAAAGVAVRPVHYEVPPRGSVHARARRGHRMGGHRGAPSSHSHHR